MSRRILGLLALVIGATTIWALPAASLGKSDLAQVKPIKQTTAAVRALTQRAGTGIAGGDVRKTVKGASGGLAGKIEKAISGATRSGRATSTDPQLEPPMRGTDPHGQGTVAVVDTNPSPERPQPDSTTDHKSGEDIIAGRARGEQLADGSYRGHITVLELLGSELVGVNTVNGQTQHGPLQPLQQAVLDPLCDASANAVCLSVLTADSTTTATGSTNDFAVAKAQLGGASGLGVGAAESHGDISTDGQCQSTAAVTKTANVSAGLGVVAGAANSASASRQCTGAAEQTQQSSQVLNLGGLAVPLPAAGCGAGTPDTRFGPLAPVATIVCNADDVSASGVRQALDVFALSTGGTSLVQDSTAQSESHSVAPAAAAASVPQCSDGVDNDGDGKIDYPADKGCTSAKDTSEAGDGNGSSGNKGSGANGAAQCADKKDNDGDGLVDAADPGCHSDGNAANKASYDASDNSEAGGGGAAQCSDGRDNDSDGLIDAADPGCHSDGNAANKASYDASDNSEANGAVGVKGGSLAFTGTDVIGLALAGLLVLAGGMLLRRREDLPTQ